MRPSLRTVPPLTSKTEEAPGTSTPPDCTTSSDLSMIQSRGNRLGSLRTIVTPALSRSVTQRSLDGLLPSPQPVTPTTAANANTLETLTTLSNLHTISRGTANGPSMQAAPLACRRQSPATSQTDFHGDNGADGVTSAPRRSRPVRRPELLRCPLPIRVPPPRPGSSTLPVSFRA